MFSRSRCHTVWKYTPCQNHKQITYHQVTLSTLTKFLNTAFYRRERDGEIDRASAREREWEYLYRYSSIHLITNMQHTFVQRPTSEFCCRLYSYFQAAPCMWKPNAANFQDGKYFLVFQLVPEECILSHRLHACTSFKIENNILLSFAIRMLPLHHYTSSVNCF